MPKTSQEIKPAGIRLIKEPADPLYLQLYRQFREMILQCRLRPGDRLPASRNLAKDLQVSRVIVNQAYEQLILEGYLIGRTGAGTFVADTIPDQMLNASTPNTTASSKSGTPTGSNPPRQPTASHNRPGTHLTTPFQIGTPALDQFPYRIWQQVAGKVLKDLKGFNIGYNDTLGHWPLREAIASYLRMARAVNCNADQVIVVTGSQAGLNLITRTLLHPGDKVWMEDPGYHGAKAAFLRAGASLCPIPIQPDGLDIDYALDTCSEARMAYITPSHQFPLGCTLSQEKRLRLLELASQNNYWILEDDYDSEFRYEGSPLASLQGLDKYRRVIYTGTFSKVLFPGLRLAYIVLPSADMVDEFAKNKRNDDRQSPIMEQLIVTKFLEEGYFLRHIRKMRMLYAERQTTLLNLIGEMAGDRLHPTLSPSGMQMVFRLPENTNIPVFRKAVIEKGLTVIFIEDYCLEARIPHFIALGFTAFTRYRMKIALAALMECLELAL